MTDLSQLKVAILTTDGYEQSELLEPKAALEELGVDIHVVAPDPGVVKGWKDGNWADEVKVNRTLDIADPMDYAMLVLPGGVINPDKLRRSKLAVD